MSPSRRTVLRSAMGLALVAGTGLAGCARRVVTLTDVLAAADGRLVDGASAPVGVGALLADARDRPVTLSFAYVGCNGTAPRLQSIRRAVDGVTTGRLLHLVLDAIDTPRRHEDVVRDVEGSTAPVDPETVRILFVRPDDLQARQDNRAAQAIMAAMNMRAGQEGYLETVSGTGLFDRSGAFVGIYY